MSSIARRHARLGDYLDHYADFFPSRPLAVVALTVVVGAMMSVPFALTVGGTGLSLLGLIYLALRRARRDQDQPRAFQRFAWATGILVCALSILFCALALELFIHDGGAFRRQATLLLIGVMVLTALQAHMTTAAYLAAMAPPVATFLIVGTWVSNQARDKSLGFAVVLFTVMILITTWRQQATDRKLGEVRADLAERNDELARALEETGAQREAAEGASRAKSRLLATASHEIRTPLNAILGLAEGLRRKVDDGEQRELAEGIVTSGEMLMRLLNAVLDLSRIDARRAQSQPQVFDLSRMLDDVVGIWRDSAKALGAELVVERSGFEGPCFIDADKGRLEQTLVNLISNALKFSGQGRVTVRAAMTQGEAATLRLEVADHGRGVDPEHRARIFEPFEQTDEGRKVGGAGLGLAICCGNVALLDGRIGLDETPGGGCTFWFEVPVTPTEAPIEAEVVAPIEGQRPLRVLAAEDNAANRRVIQVLLEPFGVDLTLVEDGVQAVEAYGVGRYDLVLMDAQMPELDGLGAVQKIRALEGDGPRTPIHMLTANVFEEDVAKYLDAGADGVVAKPISLAELGACLAKARRDSPVSVSIEQPRLQANAGFVRSIRPVLPTRC